MSFMSQNSSRGKIIIITIFILVVGAIIFFTTANQSNAPQDTQQDSGNDKVVGNNDNNDSKMTNQPPTTKEITVVGNEYSFSPSSIVVKSGEPVRIVFKNEGESMHNLVIQGLNKQTNTVGSGQVDVLEFTAPVSGIYDFICSIGDHRARGMTGKFITE